MNIPIAGVMAAIATRNRLSKKELEISKLKKEIPKEIQEAARKGTYYILICIPNEIIEELMEWMEDADYLLKVSKTFGEYKEYKISW